MSNSILPSSSSWSPFRSLRIRKDRSGGGQGEAPETSAPSSPSMGNACKTPSLVGSASCTASPATAPPPPASPFRRTFSDRDGAMRAAEAYCEVKGHVCYRIVSSVAGYTVVPDSSSRHLSALLKSAGGWVGGSGHGAPSTSEGCLCLHEAIFNCEVSEALSLCRQPGINVARRTAYPLLLTPLHLAAASGNVELFNAVAARISRPGDFQVRWGCPAQYERDIKQQSFYVRRPAHVAATAGAAAGPSSTGAADSGGTGYSIVIPNHARAMLVIPDLVGRNAERLRLFSVLDSAYLSGSAGMIWRVTELLSNFGLLSNKEKRSAVARLFRMRFLRLASANSVEHVPWLDPSAWAAAVGSTRIKGHPVPRDSVWLDTEKLYGTVFWMMEAGASPTERVTGLVAPQMSVTPVQRDGSVLYPRCRMPTLTPVCHAVFTGNATAFAVLLRSGFYRDVSDLDEAVFHAHCGVQEASINVNQLMVHITHGFLTQRSQEAFDRVMDKISGLKVLVRCFVDIRKTACSAGLPDIHRASHEQRKWALTPQLFARCARRVQCWNFWWFDEQRELFTTPQSCAGSGMACEKPMAALSETMESMRAETRAYAERDVILWEYDDIMDILSKGTTVHALEVNWEARSAASHARARRMASLEVLRAQRQQQEAPKQLLSGPGVALPAPARVAPSADSAAVNTPHVTINTAGMGGGGQNSPRTQAVLLSKRLADGLPPSRSTLLGDGRADAAAVKGDVFPTLLSISGLMQPLSPSGRDSVVSASRIVVTASEPRATAHSGRPAESTARRSTGTPLSTSTAVLTSTSGAAAAARVITLSSQVATTTATVASARRSATGSLLVPADTPRGAVARGSAASASAAAAAASISVSATPHPFYVASESEMEEDRALHQIIAEQSIVRMQFHHPVHAQIAPHDPSRAVPAAAAVVRSHPAQSSGQTTGAVGVGGGTGGSATAASTHRTTVIASQPRAAAEVQPVLRVTQPAPQVASAVPSAALATTIPGQLHRSSASVVPPAAAAAAPAAPRSSIPAASTASATQPSARGSTTSSAAAAAAAASTIRGGASSSPRTRPAVTLSQSRISGATAAPAAPAAARPTPGTPQVVKGPRNPRAALAAAAAERRAAAAVVDKAEAETAALVRMQLEEWSGSGP